MKYDKPMVRLSKITVSIFVVFCLQQIAYGLDLERDTNLPGGDYKSFKITNDYYLQEHHLCWDACKKDDKCVAWTFVKPNIQGSSSVCWLKDRVPSQVKDTCCISGKLDSFEYGIDRKGKDYRNIWLSTPVPKLCKQACDDDLRCLSWTYVNPGVQGSKARCWLKDSIPKSSTNTCCISGVTQGIEVGIDRPGSDSWPSFTLSKAQPRLCREMCRSRTGCLAWTYVKPGIQGKEARCWLKNSIPPSTKQACCISGTFEKNTPPNYTGGFAGSNSNKNSEDYGDSNNGSATGSSCFRTGLTCYIAAPSKCFGRVANWEVAGKYKCQKGKDICIPEKICTQCGDECGACEGQSCETDSECAPGSVCGRGGVCRTLINQITTSGGLPPCSQIDGICWTPDEISKPSLDDMCN